MLPKNRNILLAFTTLLAMPLASAASPDRMLRSLLDIFYLPIWKNTFYMTILWKFLFFAMIYAIVFYALEKVFDEKGRRPAIVIALCIAIGGGLLMPDPYALAGGVLIQSFIILFLFGGLLIGVIAIALWLAKKAKEDGNWKYLIAILLLIAVLQAVRFLKTGVVSSGSSGGSVPGQASIILLISKELIRKWL